jgi:hypothetical protein
MAETHHALRLNGIRETVRAPLRLLTDQLHVGLHDNLRSVSVVGSSLTEDFKPGVSDINTVIVLDRHSTPALSLVASLAKSLRRQGLAAPLLITCSYIDRSRDVFGVEFLDFQLVHETIFGDDPFAPLTFEKDNVRLQCERELKSMLVKMQQGYLICGGDPRLVREEVIAGAKELAPLLRAMLWLKDIERPKTMAASLHRAAEQFNVELDAAIEADRWRQERRRLTAAEVEAGFEDVFAAVDSLTQIIDDFEL